MPFDSLPGRLNAIPIAHFEPLRPPPVVPTAELALELSKQISETWKSLSPKEREKEQLNMDALRTTLHEHKSRDEYQQLRNQQLKQNLQNDKEIHDQNNKDFGFSTADASDLPNFVTDYTHPHPVHIDEIPTTHPWDYYGEEQPA